MCRWKDTKAFTSSYQYHTRQKAASRRWIKTLAGKRVVHHLWLDHPSTTQQTLVKRQQTDCSERLADNHKIRVDDHELTVHERERIGDSREQTEENMDECNGYRSRDESSSESSLSSDSSTSKSLDEIQADLLDHMNMTENIDFVFSDDFNMGLSHSEDMLDWWNHNEY